MPSESNTPWQTYRNNFYTLQYPAYYQIAQEDKIKGEVTLQNNNLPLVFISSGEKTLIFKENWQVVSPEQAATAKLLATENINSNGVRYQKNIGRLTKIPMALGK